MNANRRPAVASPASDVRRYQAGEVQATAALATRATRLALRTAAALLQSREEAGDVAQDVAVDVLRSLSKLRDPDAFDAWVHRIAVRHSLRRLNRRGGASTETPLALLSEGDEPAAPPGPDRDAVVAARQALTIAFARLPPRQRVALVLRYVHDLSDAEIAAAMGCRTGSVHSLLSRGRSALRADPRLAALAPAFTGG